MDESAGTGGLVLHVWPLQRGDEGLLSEGERLRAARFASASARARYVARRTRVREILGAHLGCCPRALVFRDGPHGRPVVDGISFSISSTGDVAALAVSRGRRVGLDIETIAPVDAPTVSRSLAPGERAALEALPESEQPRAFCRAWTRKEAYLKARNLGLQIDPRTCEVTLGPMPRLLACEDGEARRWILRAFSLAPEIEGAICVAACEDEGTDEPGGRVRAWTGPVR